MLIIFVLLIILPIFLSLSSIYKRIIVINNNKKIRFKTENTILIIELTILIILNAIFLKLIGLTNLFLLDLCAVIIIILLYKPIKIICIRHRRKVNDYQYK